MASQAFVYDVATYEVVETVPLSSNSWHMLAALQRGQVYEWYVTAQIAERTIESSPARFQVADANTAKALAQQDASSRHSPLEWGVCYAWAGLYDEAEAQLRAEIQNNPDSADAQALLRVLEDVRQIPYD